MRITLDEEDAVTIAEALVKSRRMQPIDFSQPFALYSAADEIYAEALRIVVALRNKQEALCRTI